MGTGQAKGGIRLAGKKDQKPSKADLEALVEAQAAGKPVGTAPVEQAAASQAKLDVRVSKATVRGKKPGVGGY